MITARALISIGIIAVIAAVSAALASSARTTHEDDAYLIFQRTPPGGDASTTQLYRIQVAGRNTGGGLVELKLTHAAGGAFNPAAVPGQTRIVFNHPPATPPSTGSRGLFRMLPLQGTPFSPKTLALDIGCEVRCLEQFAPSVSPDGTKIAFLVAYGPLDANEAADHVDLVVANLDGTDQRVLRSSSWVRDGREPTYRPAWSPDGSRLAFVDNYSDGRSVLYVMRADGTNPRRLTRKADDIRHPGRPAWSPDGTLIAFNLARRTDRVPEIHVIRPDGTGLRQLTRSPGNTGAWAPAWSGDGLRIAFARWDPDWRQSDLWVMQANGSTQTRVKRTQANENAPTWVPG